MRRYPVKFRVVYFIVLLIFVFGALWLISDRNKSVAEYRSEIINLSRQYIKALANIQSIGPDDAYSAELTGYDLKKTLAVILDDTLRRVDEIELKLSNLTVITPDKSIKQSSEYHNPVSLVSHTLRGLKMRNNEELNYKTIDHLALLQDAQEKCVVDARDISLYPECFSKIEWLRSGWTNHQCYTELGVDGSECSFVRYLSEVENFCPPLDSRRFFKYRRKAEITRNLEGLLSLLASDQYHSVSKSFMRARLKRMWPDWLTGVQHYINGSTSQSSSADHCKHCSSANETCIARCRSTSFVGQPILFGRPKLNILLHLGFLTNGVGYSFESHIAKGGPLGELVQWTDLIAALYILGHNITITYEVAEAKLKLLNPYLDLVPCQVEGNKYDLVYTDIIGYKGMKKHKIRVPSCKFRILDTFGTEAAYNPILHIFSSHTGQFFLGFVTEAFSPKSKPGPQVSKPIALVYGKENYMWIGRTNYLKILSDYFELHGNVWGNNEDLPKFVHIHQLQYGQSYLQLLSKAQVMIGLGFPYEGPGPLEAIANGIIFLNPRFNPPHSRSNQKFFRDKPTSRSLTSQHPYIENYIGEPYSYLIDMENETQIRSTVEQLLTSITNEGYRPHEYTPWDFLNALMLT
ncbi:unnamed protein product [Heterobilharzia americana]|nr:unnamed protein product [Heterobilharzia americana]